MSALRRLINNGLHRAGVTPFHANNDGSLQTAFVHTNCILSNAPLSIKGFSVGFTIQRDNEGKFEIVKNRTGYTGHDNLRGSMNYVSNQTSEVTDKADTLETAKSKCLDAFKGHLETEETQLEQRSLPTMSVVVAPKAVPA